MKNVQDDSYATLKTDLKVLRDELRLKMHLANMDLKDEWTRLEPQVDKVWAELNEASIEAAKTLKKDLMALRDRVTKN